MGREQECPLSAQLPISASVVGRYDVVVRSDVGIDRLVTDLEDAPETTANRERPTIIVIGFPVSGNERAGGQVPALGEVIVDERLQGHGIHVGAILLPGKGPDVQDQKAGCYVQSLIRQEDDKTGSSRPFFGPQ